MKNDATFPAGKKWTGSENKGRDDIVNVIIPDGFTEISFEAFRGCKNLRYVYIPKSVKKIGFGAFDGCSSLAIVEGFQGVKSVGKNAFNGTALKEIVLPAGVELGERPGFDYGYSFLTNTLQRIDVKKGKSGYIYSEDGVLFDTYAKWKHGLTLAVFPAGRKGSYEIPDAVKCIGGYAFYHSHLEEILIPEGVEKISWHAFDGCVNLKRIVFPSSLQKIEYFALAKCPRLEEVIFLSSKVVEIGSEFASGSKSLRRIVIPDAANCDPDWLKGAPASVNVETVAGASPSKQEFVEALKEHDRTKSDVVIAGLRAGHGNPSNISAEMVKRALQAKNNIPYFALCAEILFALGEYRATFKYYEWGDYESEGDYLNRLLDCAEKIEMSLDEMNRVCMLLAENSGLGEKEKFHYSYMESDFDENPYDPSHWTVDVTNYQYAFKIVKLAAEQNDDLCLRFLKIVPSDYESKIVNGETNNY